MKTVNKVQDGYEVDGIVFTDEDDAQDFADDLNGVERYCDSECRFSKHGMLTKHKAFELDVEWLDKKNVRTLFNLSTSYRIKTDHAGLHFFLQVWRFKFEFNIYDTRHWDHKKECWE